MWLSHHGSSGVGHNTLFCGFFQRKLTGFFQRKLTDYLRINYHNIQLSSQAWIPVLSSIYICSKGPCQLVHSQPNLAIHCMDIQHHKNSTIVQTETIFATSCFLSWTAKPFNNGVISWSERICFCKSKFFYLRVDPNWKGRETWKHYSHFLLEVYPFNII